MEQHLDKPISVVANGTGMQNRMILIGIVLAMLIALAAIASILSITTIGPSITGDAVYYIAGARNILNGDGYARPSGDGGVRPITAFPPGFSIALAAWGLFGVDAVRAAALMNSILFGVNLLLVQYLVYLHTRSVLGSLVAGVVLLSTRELHIVHLSAMSEPLFLTLTLAGLAALSLYIRKGRRPWILLAGLLFGLSAMTRYAGLSWVFLLVPAIVFAQDLSRRRRLADLGFSALLSLAPAAAWILRNRAVGGTAANRALRFHLTRADVAEALDRASVWLISEEMARRPRIILFVIAVSLAMLALTYLATRIYFRRDLTDSSYFPLLLVILIFEYLALFAFAVVFLDDTMTILYRYMMPVILAALLAWLTIVFGGLNWGRLASALKSLTVLGSAAFVVTHGSATVDLVRDPGYVYGYLDVRIAGSATIDKLEDLPEDTVIITNEVEKIYILTGRESFMVPIWFNAYTNEPREDFEQQMKGMRQKLSEGAILVLFDTYDFRQSIYPPREELVQGLVHVFDGWDGDIYVDTDSRDWSEIIGPTSQQ